MKKSPTTFELAQVAALAAPPNTRPKDAIRRAMELWQEAEVELAEHQNRVDYLRCLFGGKGGGDGPLFTDTPEEWAARIKGYPGDERDVRKALREKLFSTADIEKRLYRDKSLSRDTRHRLFLGLVRASIRFEMAGPPILDTATIDYLQPGGFLPPQAGFPIHPKNVELAKANHRGFGPVEIPANEVRFVEQIEGVLSQPTLNAHQVRWAVEVRQKLLVLAKSRDIPQSLQKRSKEREKDENIQFKPPHHE